MKCSRCGAEMKIKNIETGTDKNGNPIYHKYAFCYNCRIKRDLEKKKTTPDSHKPNPRKKKRRRKKNILIPVIIVLLLAASIAAGFLFYRKLQTDKKKDKNTVVTDTRKNLITPEAYSEIKTGMSLSEITELIGNDGNLLTRTSNESATTERYQWITKGGLGTVLLTFVDEKLISISQTGMENDDAKISSDTEPDIKAGMTLEEANTALGASGIRISETVSDGITTTVYGWNRNGQKYQYTIVFVDGEVQHINSISYGDNPESSGTP